MTPLTTLAQALKDDAQVNEICKAVWLVVGETDSDPCLVVNCQETPIDTVGVEPSETRAVLIVYCYARSFEQAYDLRNRVRVALHGRTFAGTPDLESIRFTGQQAAIVPTTGQSAIVGIPLTFECMIRRA